MGHCQFFLYFIHLANLALTMAILFSMSLALLLNDNNSSHYKWFEIIEVLNECKDFHRIGLNDYKFVEKYLNLIKKCKLLIEIFSLIFLILCVLFFSLVVISGFEIKTYQVGLTKIIWYFIFFSSIVPNIYFSFLYYYTKIARLE